MKKLLLLILLLTATNAVFSQKATARFDVETKYQKITGFGGFVCGPQFNYGHMTDAEIKKVWGPSSTIGCNIMRLFLPIGEGSWSQSLATAKLAKKLGLIVFASPWGQPAEWKTNGTSNATNDKGEVGSLKKTNWKDYAAYLEKYVQYLRKNGVELDAISIQNEPNWTPKYAGCKWTTSEMAEFVKTYGRQISCKIMTPESIGCSDDYVNALNKDDVLGCFDIYGGHQYGGIQSAYKNLAAKGKEIWMTEYLINWNENKEEKDWRNFDFSQDFFDFFRAINTCMMGNFNAWIHYASKRFYAMIGDGKCSTTNGGITKRGYIMAHFAKFVTGMTRISATFGGGLEGSAYLSQTGDTIVAVMANATDKTIDLTLDLPFYTQKGELRTTGMSQSFRQTVLTSEAETCRPVATIAAQSVATVMFIKSRDRQPSDMKGSVTYFDRKLLDEMTTTKTSFGTNYKMSNKTKTFDSSNPLISSRKNLTYGYIALDGSYDQLVMHINKVTTTSALTAGATTLYYVNSDGKVANHLYGRMDLSRGEDFDLVFDLSPTTLADGCIGLLSLTCDNAVSKLTINFGDVYLTSGNTTYAGTLSGAYVGDDSNVLDFSTDAACTSIDMTAVTGVPTSLPWLEGSNRVVYVSADSELSGANVVKDGVCAVLTVNEAWGPFRPATPFTAATASYTCEVNGQHILQLPFEATVPEGVNVYTLTEDLQPVAVTTIPANQPILVEGQGAVTFYGSGAVSYAPCQLSDNLLPIVTPTGISALTRHSIKTEKAVYNLHGQRVEAGYRGLVIRNGKKQLNH